MESVTLKVTGMTCGGCASSIKNALNSHDGVNSSAAQVDAGTVTIEFDPAVIQQPALEQAIVDAGFDIAA